MRIDGGQYMGREVDADTGDLKGRKGNDGEQIILRHMTNQSGINLIDLSRDCGIRYEDLDKYYNGDATALSKEELRSLDKAAEELVLLPEKHYLAIEESMGRTPTQRTVFHELRDAGYEVEKRFGVKVKGDPKPRGEFVF